MTGKLLAGFVLLLLLGYGLVEARHIIAGPSISLTVPSTYTTFEEGFIHVSGVAKNTETLAINGGPLLMDEQGNFDDVLLLPSGGAILSLTAKDRFGRVHTETRTIYIP